MASTSSLTPLNIVHTITSLGQGGAERMLVKVATELQKRGHRNQIVVLGQDNFFQQDLERAGIPVKFLGLKKSGRNFWSACSQLRRILQNDIDVAQSWLYHADFLTTMATVGLTRPRLAWNLRC